VIHRDIKPSNILCCGTGRGELFKIADFGVSRARGLSQTFVHSALGTPGYAAPEQVMMEDEKIGAATDVFALAATTFALLTGEELFVARSITDILSMVQGKKRRSIRECARLVLDLRDQPGVCAAIDGAIAHATTPDAALRPQNAKAFALAITSALRVSSVRSPLSVSRRGGASLIGIGNMPKAPPAASGWRFHVRHALGDPRAIWSAAWDGAGSCLAATTRGLEFWDGTRWVLAPTGDIDPHKLRLVHYEGAGEWLLGGQNGQLASYCEGTISRIAGPKQKATFVATSGDFKDLAVLTGILPTGAHALFASVGGHWLKPLELADLASLPALARIDNERWLVAGRERVGRAFVAFYWPLEWRLERLPADEVRAYLAGASATDVATGVVVGAGGRVVRAEAGTITRSTIPDSVDLSAAAVEDSGRVWAASLGRLWVQTGAQSWECAWHDARWDVPLVSLYADGQRVLGVAADGGMVEGLSS
jgi:hypothetical protein